MRPTVFERISKGGECEDMAVGKKDFVAQRGLEPPTSGSAGQRSDPLSYGRTLRVGFAFASRRLAKMYVKRSLSRRSLATVL